MKKTFSLLMCLMLTLAFAMTPMVSFAVPEDDAGSPATSAPTTPTTAPTTASTKAPTTTTTAKPTTKGTKATTKKKTTASTSSSGKLTVSSKRSESSTGENGKVVVIYTINNTGSVTAKNIKLKDADIAGSNVIQTIDSLAAGESKTVEYEATLTRDSDSVPVVTCTMNGSSKSFTGSRVKIPLKGSGSLLSATITTANMNIQPNTPVKFSLVLKNDDSSTISDIAITDYAGKAIKSGISLNSGSTTNVEFELSLTGDTNVYVNVKGKNSSGTEITSKSNELAMKVDTNAVPVTEGISILVHSDKTELEKAGDVNLTIEIKNLMPKAFINVTIIDKSTNTTMQTISLLSGNDSKTYTSTVNIDKNTSFLYEVTATYEDGTPVTILSNSLEIKIAEKSFAGMTIIIVIVAVIVLLIVATSITLYVLSKKEKEKNKSIGAAQSEKYRKKTPKKKGRKKAKEEIAPPRSTFTIDEDEIKRMAAMDSAMQGVSAFENYGEDSSINLDDLESAPSQSNYNDGLYTAPIEDDYSSPQEDNYAPADNNYNMPEYAMSGAESYAPQEESTYTAPVQDDLSVPNEDISVQTAEQSYSEPAPAQPVYTAPAQDSSSLFANDLFASELDSSDSFGTLDITDNSYQNSQASVDNSQQSYAQPEADYQQPPVSNEPINYNDLDPD